MPAKRLPLPLWDLEGPQVGTSQTSAEMGGEGQAGRQPEPPNWVPAILCVAQQVPSLLGLVQPQGQLEIQTLGLGETMGPLKAPPTLCLVARGSSGLSGAVPGGQCRQ